MPTEAATSLHHSRHAGKDLHPVQAPSPIVKWAGGKGNILGQLMPLLPPGVELMRHVEPFVGGGALFFRRQPERALLCDINQALINTYEAVRDDVETVIELLERLARRHSTEAYYEVRERYNAGACARIKGFDRPGLVKAGLDRRSLGGVGPRRGANERADRTRRAAMFLYLNKTCFNGLHRVNRHGEFNVPAGRPAQRGRGETGYSAPQIVNAEALRAASRALAATDLHCEGFEVMLRLARPGDFIYLDPPYEPVSGTANFTAYERDGFTREDQTRLSEVFAELDRRGCKLMLSNSDVPFIHELYENYRIDKVAALRAVNCDGRNRGRVSEVVVRNYA